MTITDIAAWYAAAVATAVFAWDIIKWVRSGPRLRINTKCNISYADGRVIESTSLEGGALVSTLAEYCHIEILNTGDQPTTLIDVEAAHEPNASGNQMSCSSIAFMVHSGSNPLPALLGPGEMWSARLEMRRLEGLATEGKPVIRARTSYRNKPILAFPVLKGNA
ncbi:hypothetical protein [Thiobacillus denitrificans]|uniref:hypothetical protein n=1 Tax=Thiobacillus denitrificans TaxID=36861 RepID=UPI00035F1270|nr:hypothetical protein [Thiobacillus denitrificans]